MICSFIRAHVSLQRELLRKKKERIRSKINKRKKNNFEKGVREANSFRTDIFFIE